MVSIVIPRTNYTLEVQEGVDMFIRGVEVFVGTPEMELHRCEVRYMPLYESLHDTTDEINAIRIREARRFLHVCQEAARDKDMQILHFRIHLAPEIDSWHTMFEVRVNTVSVKEKPDVELVIPFPTRPKIQLEKKLALVSTM